MTRSIRDWDIFAKVYVSIFLFKFGTIYYIMEKLKKNRSRHFSCTGKFSFIWGLAQQCLSPTATIAFARSVCRGLMVHSHLWFITRLRLQMRFSSMEWIANAIAISKVVAQPIIEPNGNRNPNRIINHRCERTLRKNNITKMRNEPSLHMPTRWHFIKRQNWQELRLNGVISHFWSLLQRWFIPCVKHRRKNPCKNTKQKTRREIKFTSRTFFGHAH